MKIFVGFLLFGCLLAAAATFLKPCKELPEGFHDFNLEKPEDHNINVDGITYQLRVKGYFEMPWTSCTDVDDLVDGLKVVLVDDEHWILGKFPNICSVTFIIKCRSERDKKMFDAMKTYRPYIRMDSKLGSKTFLLWEYATDNCKLSDGLMRVYYKIKYKELNEKEKKHGDYVELKQGT